MVRCNYGVVSMQPNRVINHIFAIFIAAALPVLCLSAPSTAHAQTVSLDNSEKQSRSAFEYLNGHVPEKRPYKQPKLDVDPTDLSVEELRERLNYLEERIERLEHALAPKRGVQR